MRLKNQKNRTTWVTRKQKALLKSNLMKQDQKPSNKNQSLMRPRRPKLCPQRKSIRLKINLNCSNKQLKKNNWPPWKNKWSLKHTLTKKFPWKSNLWFKSKLQNCSQSTSPKGSLRSSKMKRNSKTNNFSRCKTSKNKFWAVCKTNTLLLWIWEVSNSKCQANKTATKYKGSTLCSLQ